jgi:hypothetical protein
MENSGVTGIGVDVGLNAGISVGVMVARFTLTWVSVGSDGVNVAAGGVSVGGSVRPKRLISSRFPQELKNNTRIPRNNPGIEYSLTLDEFFFGLPIADLWIS